MPYATTPEGTRLYFETLGEGAPLLLIAGQAFDHHMWDGVRDDFTAQHQVIVYDHRSTGLSDQPEQPPCSIAGFAQDALCVLDALGIARAHVYGFSMGGRIAQRLGIDHADRVLSLVLGATTPGNAQGVRRPAEADAVLASGKPAALQALLVPPDWQAAHPAWTAMMAERARHPMPPHAQRQHYLASEAHEAWAELPRITAPTLVLHGTADQINVCANAELLAQRIPGAQLHLIEGARHGYFWAQREEASRVVRQFLRNNARPAAA
jgi:3-oxoadipate enol-lactonase